VKIKGLTMVKKKSGIDITTHMLVPEHSLLSEKEKKTLLEHYAISLAQLPKIFLTDPAIEDLGAKPGDVIKIVKKSSTAGEAVYYRGVISE